MQPAAATYCQLRASPRAALAASSSPSSSAAAASSTTSSTASGSAVAAASPTSARAANATCLREPILVLERPGGLALPQVSPL